MRPAQHAASRTVARAPAVSRAGTHRPLPSERIDDVTAHCRADRTLTRLVEFFLMADRNPVVVDDLARPLQLETDKLRTAIAQLESDGLIECDHASSGSPRCQLTRRRELRALARTICSTAQSAP